MIERKIAEKFKILASKSLPIVISKTKNKSKINLLRVNAAS